jgi:hypothetical protein
MIPRQLGGYSLYILGGKTHQYKDHVIILIGEKDSFRKA